MKEYMFHSSVLIPVIFIGYVFMKPWYIFYISEINLFLYRGLLADLLLLVTVLWLINRPSKSCKKGSVYELCFNILPVEGALMLFLAQYHFVVVVFIFSIIAAINLLLYFCMKRQGINKKYRQRLQQRFFYKMSALALFLPSMVSLFGYNLEAPHYVAKQEIIDNMNSTQAVSTEASQAADIMDENNEFYQCLHEERWEKCDVEERITIVQKLIDLETRKLGIPDVEVSTQKLDIFTMGKYNNITNEMQIDIQHLEKDSLEDVINTCLHETYHAYQNYVVKNIQWDEEFSKCSFFQEAREWRNNEKNYEHGYQDYDAYSNQPLEMAANSYAERELEVILKYMDGESIKESNE